MPRVFWHRALLWGGAAVCASERRGQAPGPSGALQTCHTNLARNSPMTLSNPEIRPLELQRFYALLNLHPIELHATLWKTTPHRRPRTSQPVPSGSSGALHASGGGFAALEAGWRRVAGVSMF